jgi:hypothetical protein
MSVKYLARARVGHRQSFVTGARLARRRWRSSRPGSTRARGTREGQGEANLKIPLGAHKLVNGQAADVVGAVSGHRPASYDPS